MSKILIVEDEPELATEVRDWLEREMHIVDIVGDGTSALNQMLVYQYDLVLLDWMLPGVPGIEICKEYRRQHGEAAIILLTAKGTVDDRALGLDSGADDYLTKPFALKELSARIRAVLRRSDRGRTGLSFGSLTLDPVARRVTIGEHEVHLEPKEFNLLEFFMRHPDTVFSPQTLIDKVWESETTVSPEAIRTYVKGIRKKLDKPNQPSLITTIYGSGYRFETKHAL